MKTLRFGLLSTAHIARKNWAALRQAGNCQLVAVSGRDLARTQRFIDACQAVAAFDPPPRALPSHEALLAAPDVDAVYVPLPTAVRSEWVIRAARAGKHVVCEKPCAPDSAELERMLEACRDNGVQFMDGVMFMHHPRLDRIRAALDAGDIGSIRRITSVFSFLGDEAFFKNNIRLQAASEPAGSLGDLGWYCVRFALWSMGWTMPLEVHGRTLRRAGDTAAGVPIEFSAELLFPQGVSAAFYSSFTVPDQQWVTVSGSKGWVRVDDFVLPANDAETRFALNGNYVSVLNREIKGVGGTQQARMFRAFADQVLSGKQNAAWPEWSRKTQRVIDACLESARRGCWVTVG